MVSEFTTEGYLHSDSVSEDWEGFENKEINL